LFPILSFAQNGPWEIGAIGGFSTYFGDIAPNKGISTETSEKALGFYLKKEVTPFLSLKSTFLVTSISGDDYLYLEQPLRIGRGFFFNTSITEIALLPEWEPFASEHKPRFSPKFFIGPSVFIIDPEANFDRNKIDGNKEGIIIDQAKDYPGIILGLTGGIGVNFQISDYFQMDVSAGLRAPFTDYLDGISEAANPQQNDWYGLASVSIGYRFTKPDDDGDGVANANDKCPEVAGSPAFNGCPDTDGDGIEDLVDQCPLEAGTLKLFGCPDSDDDGITDKNDRCPHEAGSLLHFGCPYKDSDEDGIDDLHDDCPLVAGTENRNGCPEVDTDNDGILDEDDNCPKIFGIAIFKGCPDTDGDGVEDAKDDCPKQFGLYENSGCPVILTANEEAKGLNRQLIHFNTGKYDPISYTQLDKVTTFMKRNTSFRLKLNGYSDSGGSSDQNKYISRKRAKNCYNYLIRQGVLPSRMSYHGFGEIKPIASNKTKEGRSQNRRVEIEIYQ
jgi:outer membrane protein OmpA-like peptidoglycan-associated protein